MKKRAGGDLLFCVRWSNHFFLVPQFSRGHNNCRQMWWLRWYFQVGEHWG